MSCNGWRFIRIVINVILNQFFMQFADIPYVTITEIILNNFPEPLLNWVSPLFFIFLP